MTADAAILRSGPAVQVAGLRRRFGAVDVLDGIDLRMSRGEFLALLGPSGTGKSTLLRILAGLDRNATGRVVVPNNRAVLFQDARLLPWRSVGRNITLGLRKVSASDVGRILREVGLPAAYADRWPGTLSGGEAQRVALARALVREPDLLLLDEPFGALDALTRIRMQQQLADVHRQHGSAVVLVTHDVEEAILLADRVVVLAGGRMRTDIAIDLPKPRTRSDPNVVALRQQLLGDLGVHEEAPARPSVAPRLPAGAGLR